MNGTLNIPSKTEKSIYKVKKIHYPTISIIFDEGWQIDMRLHNADSKVKITGLKFDVQLTGQPNGIYQQQRSWFE